MLPEKRNENKEMVLSVEAVIKALLLEGEDFSGYSTHWDGIDVVTKVSQNKKDQGIYDPFGITGKYEEQIKKYHKETTYPIVTKNVEDFEWLAVTYHAGSIFYVENRGNGNAELTSPYKYNETTKEYEETKEERIVIRRFGLAYEWLRYDSLIK